MEKTTAKHSWNGNWLFTNSIIFRLQRHSDHHAHAHRPYQARHRLCRMPARPSHAHGSYMMYDIPQLHEGGAGSSALDLNFHDPVSLKGAQNSVIQPYRPCMCNSGVAMSEEAVALAGHLWECRSVEWCHAE